MWSVGIMSAICKSVNLTVAPPGTRVFGMFSVFFARRERRDYMRRVEKTVFISYRRTNAPWALVIAKDLTQHGYDVFFDFTGIKSGDFERAILDNIEARAHFIVLLTPSALRRCCQPGDWLRREIETALELKRNIVPLTLEGFSFAKLKIARQLTGPLVMLKSYSALSVPVEYFDAAMKRLREEYLNVTLDAVPHPASDVARRAAREEQAAIKAAPAVTHKDLTAQELLERAIHTNDLEEAIRLFGEAISLEPEFAEAYFSRGFARMESGDCTGALRDYDEAIRLFPNNAAAFNNRGIARSADGDIEGALEDYEKAIRLKPDYVNPYYNRGISRAAKGDLDGALKDYDEAIRLNPYDADAFHNRGDTRNVMSDVEGALQDYDLAISLKPSNAVVINKRGNLRMIKGDLEGALQDYNEAIRIEPDADIHYNRAILHLEMKHSPAAIADFRRYLDLGGGERAGDREEVEKIIRDLSMKL